MGWGMLIAIQQMPLWLPAPYSVESSIVVSQETPRWIDTTHRSYRNPPYSRRTSTPRCDMRPIIWLRVLLDFRASCPL